MHGDKVRSAIIVQRYLLTLHFDPYSQGGFCALHLAAQKGHEKVIQMLVKADGDIRIRDNVCI